MLDGRPWIGIKTVDDKFMPWVASQSDMLSEDWRIYVESDMPTWEEVADMAEAEFEKELEKVTGKKSVFAYKPAKNPAPHGYKKDGVPKKKPGRKA